MLLINTIAKFTSMPIIPSSNGTNYFYSIICRFYQNTAARLWFNIPIINTTTKTKLNSPIKSLLSDTYIKSRRIYRFLNNHFTI